MTRPGGSSLVYCPDCGVLRLHELDVLSPVRADESEFSALTCRACGHVRPL